MFPNKPNIQIENIRLILDKLFGIKMLQITKHSLLNSMTPDQQIKCGILDESNEPCTSANIVSINGEHFSPISLCFEIHTTLFEFLLVK